MHGAANIMRRTVRDAVVVLLLLSLSISTAILVYLHFFAADERDLSGEWAAELDLTGRAAATAFGWLQDIEAVSLSLEDMDAYMQDLTVRIDLTLEQTERFGGNFRCSVRPESYEACRQAAYEAFAMVFLDLLADRLHMAGYTGSTDRDAVEALVQETFGMSAVSYLTAYGPALLPSLEALQAQYDGSGTYEATEDTLIRRYSVGGTATVKTEGCIRKDSTLILSEEIGADTAGSFADRYPMAFVLQQPSDG